MKFRKVTQMNLFEVDRDFKEKKREKVFYRNEKELA